MADHRDHHGAACAWEGTCRGSTQRPAEALSGSSPRSGPRGRKLAAAWPRGPGSPREIHDVLAHSLSAQLVHPEAARLLIEREPSTEFRDQVLERVVAARPWPVKRLAGETRRCAVRAPREMTPVEEFLRQLVADELLLR